MDKSFVQAIQELSPAFTEQVKELPFPAALVPQSMSVESLEQYQPTRNQYRARFATALVEDFAEYVKKHSGDECFLNTDERIAMVIFDKGTVEQPGHCQHTATLEPMITPEFKALKSFEGNSVPQRKFIEFMEDWRHFWTALDDQERLVTHPKAFAAMRSMTVENMTKATSNVDDMSSSRSAMESIEAKSAGVQLRRFAFKLVPYEGFAETEIECRFGFRASNGMELSIAIIGAGQLDKNLSDEFQALVQAKLPNIEIFKGTLKV